MRQAAASSGGSLREWRTMKKEEQVRLQNDKAKLRKLTALMNQQNKRPFPPMDPTFKLIDCVLAGDELDLLLRLGTDTYSREQALVVSAMSGDRFDPLFEALQQKGFVGTRFAESGEERYSLNPFLV